MEVRHHQRLQDGCGSCDWVPTELRVREFPPVKQEILHSLKYNCSSVAKGRNCPRLCGSAVANDKADNSTRLIRMIQRKAGLGKRNSSLASWLRNQKSETSRFELRLEARSCRICLLCGIAKKQRDLANFPVHPLSARHAAPRRTTSARSSTVPSSSEAACPINGAAKPRSAALPLSSPKPTSGLPPSRRPFGVTSTATARKPSGRTGVTAPS